MGPKIIFLIRSNPAESHRPAEAIRIAAGLGVGNISLKIILSQESPRMLLVDEEELVDEEILGKFLPYLQEMNIPLYVDNKSLSHIDLNKSAFKFRILDPDESHEILAGGHSILIF